jgi:putative spermidine/putrescine transport system substrate-binding protein
MTLSKETIVTDQIKKKADSSPSVPARTTRRNFIAGAAACMALPFVPKSAFAQDKQRVVLPTYGGAYQEMLKSCFTDPFTKETGIEVVFSGVPDFAKLKAQVMTGNPEWDVFEAGGSWFPAGANANLFEPIDTNIVTAKELVRGANKNYCPFYSWASGVAWNTAKFNKTSAPQDFTEFWDVKRFTGRRTLRNRADMTLELALVADGVDPNKLYPLDVDRAFKSLERIKPRVAKWADSTSQLVTLLTTNEVDYGYNNNGRVKATVGTSTPLDISLAQTIVSYEYIGVVKGTKRKDVAMKFVAFVLRPDRQAAFAEKISYMPGNPAAMSLVSAETKKWFPDLSTRRHIIQNDEWWAPRTEEIQQRYQEFLLS